MTNTVWVTLAEMIEERKELVTPEVDVREVVMVDGKVWLSAVYNQEERDNDCRSIE